LVEVSNRRLQQSGLSVTPAAYATVAPDWRPLLIRVSLDGRALQRGM